MNFLFGVKLQQRMVLFWRGVCISFPPRLSSSTCYSNLKVIYSEAPGPMAASPGWMMFWGEFVSNPMCCFAALKPQKRKVTVCGRTGLAHEGAHAVFELNADPKEQAFGSRALPRFWLDTVFGSGRLKTIRHLWWTHKSNCLLAQNRQATYISVDTVLSLITATHTTAWRRTSGVCLALCWHLSCADPSHRSTH